MNTKHEFSIEKANSTIEELHKIIEERDAQISDLNQNVISSLKLKIKAHLSSYDHLQRKYNNLEADMVNLKENEYSRREQNKIEENEVQTSKSSDDDYDADFSFDDLVGRYHGNKRMTEKPMLRDEFVVNRKQRSKATNSKDLKDKEEVKLPFNEETNSSEQTSRLDQVLPDRKVSFTQNKLKEIVGNPEKLRAKINPEERKPSKLGSELLKDYQSPEYDAKKQGEAGYNPMLQQMIRKTNIIIETSNSSRSSSTNSMANLNESDDPPNPKRKLKRSSFKQTKDTGIMQDSKSAMMVRDSPIVIDNHNVTEKLKQLGEETKQSKENNIYDSNLKKGINLSMSTNGGQIRLKGSSSKNSETYENYESKLTDSRYNKSKQDCRNASTGQESEIGNNSITTNHQFALGDLTKPKILKIGKTGINTRNIRLRNTTKQIQTDPFEIPRQIEVRDQEIQIDSCGPEAQIRLDILNELMDHKNSLLKGRIKSQTAIIKYHNSKRTNLDTKPMMVDVSTVSPKNQTNSSFTLESDFRLKRKITINESQDSQIDPSYGPKIHYVKERKL